MSAARAAPWPTRSLGELCEFRNGVNYTRASFGGGIKVVGVSDFQDYTKPRYDELAQINPTGIVTSRNILQDGDIVFVRSNGNRDLIGRSLLIEKPPEGVTHSAFTIRLRFTSAEVAPKFYAYLFRTPLIRRGLAASGGGTNISNLNQDLLGALNVPTPPLAVQRRIASILSAYDDLIENSERRIRVLDDMAHALYREWFILFRYPGNETAPRKTSALGPIPENWECGRLDDVLVLQRGFDLPKSDRRDGSVPVIAATGANGFHDIAKARAPGVVTGRSGSIGTVLYVQEDFWPLNTTLWVKEFPKAEPLYAYYLLSSLDLAKFDGGVAVPTLNRNALHGLPVLVPPRELQSKFQSIAGAILAMMRLVQRRIETLRETRDLLLPRLLSGQLDVGGAT